MSETGEKVAKKTAEKVEELGGWILVLPFIALIALTLYWWVFKKEEKKE